LFKADGSDVPTTSQQFVATLSASVYFSYFSVVLTSTRGCLESGLPLCRLAKLLAAAGKDSGKIPPFAAFNESAQTGV
jgi:hypothetical protein